jgi:hypothetical protein
VASVDVTACHFVGEWFCCRLACWPADRLSASCLAAAGLVGQLTDCRLVAWLLAKALGWCGGPGRSLASRCCGCGRTHRSGDNLPSAWSGMLAGGGWSLTIPVGRWLGDWSLAWRLAIVADASAVGRQLVVIAAVGRFLVPTFPESVGGINVASAVLSNGGQLQANSIGNRPRTGAAAPGMLEGGFSGAALRPYLPAVWNSLHS